MVVTKVSAIKIIFKKCACNINVLILLNDRGVYIHLYLTLKLHIRMCSFKVKYGKWIQSKLLVGSACWYAIWIKDLTNLVWHLISLSKDFSD